MSAELYQNALFEQFARVGKAVGNGRRLLLLECLAQGPSSVEVLADTAGISVANTSQHLQQLREAGLVSSRKQGQHVYYKLADSQIVMLIGLLKDIAHKNLDEVSRLVHTFLDVRDALEPVPANELMQRVRDGLVSVLDVRPRAEYEAGHIEGASNLPMDELEKRIDTLPSDGEIIAYCRGPFCIFSYDAVAKLRQHGLSARRLEFGFPEWQQAGMPVVTGLHPTAIAS